jgi:soluble lytic murein transglycosylase-like protein
LGQGLLIWTFSVNLDRMRGCLEFGRARWACVVVLSAVSALAADAGPRLDLIDADWFRSCARPVVPALPTEDVRWVLTCKLSEFEEVIDKKENSVEDPALRLLVARVLHEQLLRLRASFFVREGGASDEIVIPFVPGATPSPGEPIEPEAAGLGPAESPETAFAGAASSFEDRIAKWLAPLLNSQKPQSLLLHEAAHLQLQTLVDSGDLDEAVKILKDGASELLREGSSRRAVLRLMLDGVRAHPNQAGLANEWLAAELRKIRSPVVNGRSAEDLRYWIRSLELEPRPRTRAARESVLETLRALWVAYPLEEDQKTIRDLARALGLSQVFIAPGLRQLNVGEILVRARAQLDSVDGKGALATIRMALRVPDSAFQGEDLWEALNLHIRILRLADERPQIPAVLNSYIRKGNFLDIPKKRDDRSAYFKRLYQIARWQWSYDTPERAMQTLDRLISLNITNATTFQMGEAYYIRARIMEQRDDKTLSRIYLDESIQHLEKAGMGFGELMSDLVWRRFFNEYDQAYATGNFEGLVPLLESLKKNIPWKDDASRWHHWKGQALLLNKKKDEAIASFRDAYKLDSFSYYGVMSGLKLVELGEEPKDWILSKARRFWESPDDWDEPSWDKYFSVRSGKTLSPESRDMARIWFLTRIGDAKSANRYLSGMEREAYARIGSRKHPEGARRRFVRDIAWLRIAAGDRIGSLRMGEILRSAFPETVEPEDLAYLYPLPFRPLIERESKARKIDFWFVISLIRQESAFNPSARSIANALGLMQVIPPVAKIEAERIGLAGFKTEDLYNPDVAVKVGTAHLQDLHAHFGGSWICATAGYNAGRPPVYKWLEYYTNPNPMAFIERISFQETRNYVRLILRNYINYARIYGDEPVKIGNLVRMPELIPGREVGSLGTPVSVDGVVVESGAGTN